MIKQELIINVLGMILVLAITVFYGFQYKSQTHLISPTVLASNLPQSPVTLSLEEVKKHNTSKDCWVTINNNVYNVTNYINQHPGGTATISDYCGHDMTQAFLSQRHSALADQQHAGMLLGKIGEQITFSQVQTTPNTVDQYYYSRERDD